MNGVSPQTQNTWYSLREFETRDITSRAYYGRHSLSLSEGKAREIATSFVQAREYFRSAGQADFVVRPLLLYYGAASLSKGLILFLDPAKREASLKQGHGLSIIDWQQVLSSGLSEVGALRIRLTQGPFHDLLTATRNRFYFRSNSSAVNWAVGGATPAINSESTLEDIAARIPDVSRQYRAWTGHSPPFAKMEALEIDREEPNYALTLSGANEKVIDLVIPNTMFPDRTVRSDGSRFVVTSNTDEGIFFAQRTSMFDIGEIVVAKPLSDRSYFSPLAACFMTSYILGMLCRYFPASWTNLSRTEKGDAFLPLATKLLDWIEEVFPSMVVDVLRGPYGFEKE